MRRVSFLLFCCSAAQTSTALAQTFPAPAQPARALPPDDAISGKRRALWAIESTVGPTSIAGTALGAGWDSLIDRPKEYNTRWSGFGQRYALRTTTTASRAIMEAGLSALWDEDPRYHRAAGQPFNSRVRNIVRMTVMARDSDGRGMPAYSRFIAIPASSFLSNAWRPPSDSTMRYSFLRIGTGFLGRMAGNAWAEFWPDVRTRIFHK